MLKFLSDLIHNYMLVTAGAGWLIAQIAKVFTGMFRERSFNIGVLLFSNGGMPSSHSACIAALFTACLLQNGIGSPLTAICFILLVITTNDAVGVRYETGKQSKMLNVLVKKLFTDKDEEFNQTFRELVGHTKFQVFMGVLLGVAVAVGFAFIPLFGVL